MEQLKIVNFRTVDRLAHQSDIQFTAANFIFLLGGDKTDQLNPGIRLFAAKQGQNVGQQIDFGRRNKTNRQVVIVLDDFSRAHFGTLCLVEYRLRILQKTLPRRRQRHLAFVALKQRHADALFQIANLTAQRRLRGMQFFCRAGEV